MIILKQNRQLNETRTAKNISTQELAQILSITARCIDIVYRTGHFNLITKREYGKCGGGNGSLFITTAKGMFGWTIAYKLNEIKAIEQINYGTDANEYKITFNDKSSLNFVRIPN